MNILWVTNIPFAYHNDMLGKKNAMVTGGPWLNAAYNSSVEGKEHKLAIVTSCNVDSIQRGEQYGNEFFLIPGGDLHKFDYKATNNIKNCNLILEEVKPDLIVLWGTESKLSYLFSELSKVPILVYIQGLVTTIVQHYYDGVPSGYQTIRDLYNRFRSKSEIDLYKEQSYLEQKILKRAFGVVVENDWCEDHCLCVNSKLRVFRNKLPIREAAFNAHWNIDKIERHTIFTNAGYYPIKGHHILFQALAQVKKVFPDVKVYIPGSKYLENFDRFFSRTGYIKYIKHIIESNRLEDNIKFTGYIGEEELIERIVKCHIYVMPSLVENHSASLIEAMVVGAPCVSSLVGGVGTLIDNKSNGIIYNYLDVESLSGNIIRLFKDDELAKHLSDGTLSVRDSRKNDFGAEMNAFYHEVIN